MMASIRKNIPVIVQTLRIQLMSIMEDRIFFVSVVLGSVSSILLNVVFFQSIYGHVDTLAGWTLAEAYILLGTYHLIENIAWMTYLRGLNRVSVWVRHGEFDGYLLLPLNLKAHLSYRFANITMSIPPLITSVLLLSYGVSKAEGDLHVPMFLLLLLCGLAINFSIRVIVAAIGITNPIESPFFLTSQMMQLGQYPIQIYRGIVRQILTFVVPVGVMVSVPARALFGKATVTEILIAVAVAVVFYTFSDWLFKFQLSRYESSHG